MSAAGRKGAEAVNKSKADAKEREETESEMLAMKRAEEAETHAIEEFERKRESGEDGITVDADN